MAHILVVEDDSLTIDCLVDLLEAEEFQVTVATDGRVAQQMVTQSGFDLIICDLLLPPVSNYELLSYLRSNKKTADIPFIVLTGKSTTKDINLGWEMGVDDYLIKPFVNQNLIKSIQTQLEKRQFLEKCYQAKTQNSIRILEDFAFPSNPTKQDHCDRNTNLANSLTFKESLDRVVSQYVTERVKSASENSLHSSKIAVCCLQIDYLEDIANSKKQSGEVQLQVAQRLMSSIGNRAKIACLDDGKISIILPYLKNLTQAIAIIRAGQKSISKPLMFGSNIINLKSYVGISFNLDCQEDIATLLDHGKQLLVKAIENRDDCYEVYSPNSSTALEAKSLVLVEELSNDILAQNQLRANYQPQIDLLTGQVLGYEVLLRWHHPQRGNIPAETFITIAEDAGLIESIETKFMFDECTKLKQWHQKGFDKLKLAINVSSSQFNRHDFIVIVKNILGKVQLAPKFLTIELTETTLLKDKRKSLAHLKELKSLGVGVSVDNFERGRCSLNYLKQFPFDTIKIDLTHLNSLVKISDAKESLKLIDREASRFGLKLIISSVETKEQLTFLRQHHFAVAQGNYLTPPLEKDELEYLLSGKSEWLTILFRFPPI